MIDISEFKVHTLKDGRTIVNLILGPVKFSDGTVAEAQDKDELDKFKTHKVVKNWRVGNFDVVKVESALTGDQLVALNVLQGLTDIVLAPRTVLDALANLPDNQRESVYYKCVGQRALEENTIERVVDTERWVY